jgi:hypothetical protein
MIGVQAASIVRLGVCPARSFWRRSEKQVGRRAVPLSEDEQRILHEMEQKLYEHDRGFADRVSSESPRTLVHRSLRWAVAIFISGLVILLISFRSSLLIGTFGFFVMLFAALLFERSARQAYRARREEPVQGAPGSHRSRALADEVSLIGKRFRTRFWRDH